MLAILTAATSSALATRAGFRARYPGFATLSDAQVSALVLEASSKIAGYCDRVFGLTQYRQTMRRLCAHELRLEAPGPIVSIDALTIDGVAKVEGTDFERDRMTLYRLSTDCRIPWHGATIVVDYRTGYGLPGQSPRSLPEAIEAACLELAARQAFAGPRDPNVTEETIFGVAKFVYDAGGEKGGLPLSIAQALDPHVFRTIG